CTGISLQARVADVLDQHLEGLSVDKLAEAVNLDEIEIVRVLRALTLMGCFKEGSTHARGVFANNRVSLILKSSNNTGYYTRLHSQGVSNAARVFYDTMIDLQDHVRLTMHPGYLASRSGYEG
ncbi:uncharacterized protein BJ212DRAFT_1289404, partial [Suillus subaureus]